MSFKQNTGKFEVRIFESRETMGWAAAEAFAREADRLLQQREVLNVIFAAAPSQNEMLAALIHHDLPWHRINAFHMDEYIGLSENAPQGFGYFLKTRLFSLLNFKSVQYLNGNANDLAAECKRYTGLLDKLPVDIVCMGIGENGHLAFNDPPVADFEDRQSVKVVELDPVCRAQQVNDGCFDKLTDVPTHALTLTIPALLKASVISCVVPGHRKAKAVFQTINAAITTKDPATILRTHHHVNLFLDGDSSRLL